MSSSDCIEAARQPVEQLRRVEDGGAGRRQLEGEREVVEARAYHAQIVGALELDAGVGRTAAKQRFAVGLAHRRRRVDPFTGDSQSFSRRHDRCHGWAGRHERADRVGRGGHQVLQVVDDHEEPAVRKSSDEVVHPRPVRALSHADRGCHGGEHERRIAYGGERHPPDPVRIGIRCCGGRLQCEPRLARAAGAYQRHEAHVGIREHGGHHRQLRLPPKERCRWNRKVRPVHAAYRREARLPELEHTLRSGEILEAVLAKIGHGDVDTLSRRLRQQHLPALSRTHQAGRPVYVDPHVLGWIEPRLAGMDTDADPDRAVLQPRHRLRNRADRRLG